MATDGPRERELHRFYQPWLETCREIHPTQQISSRADGHVPQSSKDRALTAFAQLGALRLRVKRGVVTLIDSKNQYILAEATRSLSLMDDSKHAEGDELWFGNAVLPRSQGVSLGALKPPLYTAKGPGKDELRAPALIIDDIVNDERYRGKAFAGAGVRFYAGVPLVTRLGHAIGVYTVTDDQTRNGINAEELRIMLDMAVICMNHLEQIRNERARARGERLIRGIGSFIEGASSETLMDSPEVSTNKKSTNPIDQKPPERPKLSRDKQPSSEFKGMTISDMNARAGDQYSSGDDHSEPNNRVITNRTIEPRASSAKSPQSNEADKSRTSVDAVSQANGDAKPASDSKSQYLAVFDRASRILRKSMGADGVVFVDASAANLSRGTSRRQEDQSSSSAVAHSNARPIPTRAASKHMPQPARALGLDQDSDNGERYSSDNQASSLHLSDRRKEPQYLCEIIALALRDKYQASPLEITESHLRRLVRRFPQGKVYSFDSQGRLITNDDSSESGPLSDGDPGLEASQIRQAPRPKSALRHTIPDARTIVFLPLWDFAKERWNSAAVVWSSNSSKLMNIQDDLSYLKAFGNSVMNEIARLNLFVSDTAKGTFLANISHELRSPLHGILGSIEFLHDSPLDDFQSSMVVSVETCGKTLLDTVNHVLDFAKLNSLSKASIGKTGSVTQATTSDSSLTSHFDVAIVVEEAVEAVYAGQVFRSANGDAKEGGGPITSASRRAFMKRQDTRDRIIQGQHEHFQGVRLTMNIDDGVNWEITSQPGAIRRVVMNLLGNSLKYTQSGAINVSLEVDHSRDDEGHEEHLHACITVIDTGKGMSNDFVKNHAFTAFSQEDSLASGTGLGLSIIRQIVDSLGGKIDLKSQKDQGTEVKIWLTFPRHEKDDQDDQDHSSLKKSMLHEVQERTGGMQFCMLAPKIHSHSTENVKASIRQMPTVEDSLRNLAAQWFGMKVFPATSMDDLNPDFFVYAEPPPIEYLLDHHGKNAHEGMVPVIIFCQNAFQASSLRANGVHDLTDIGRIIEIIAQPVGPQKLAKVLHRCMSRAKKLEDLEEHQPSGPVTLAVSNNDEFKAPPPHNRPAMGRSAASLGERMPTLKSNEQRPGALRHQSSVTVPKDKSKQRRGSIDETSASVRPPVRTTADTKTDSSLPRVLVVDDNNINLQLLETMVRKAKHPYESATNGQKALDAYKRSSEAAGPRFNYILMDISMPIMNGITATKEIRKWEKEKQISPPVKIIALTGMGDESSAKAEAKETGFDKFLSKPIKFKELSTLLV